MLTIPVFFQKNHITPHLTGSIDWNVLQMKGTKETQSAASNKVPSIMSTWAILPWFKSLSPSCTHPLKTLQIGENTLLPLTECEIKKDSSHSAALFLILPVFLGSVSPVAFCLLIVCSIDLLMHVCTPKLRPCACVFPHNRSFVLIFTWEKICSLKASS